MSTDNAVPPDESGPLSPPSTHISPEPSSGLPSIHVDSPPDIRLPRPPHPGLGFALLWCILFLFVTQLVPGIVAVVFVIGKAITSRAEVSAEALTKDAIMPSLIGSQIMSIGFSLLVLRLVVGRDWPRQVALRLPSWPHLLLGLLAFPAVVLLANGAYSVIKQFVPDLGELLGLKGMPNMEEMIGVFGSWPLGVAVLIIGVGPGIGEELWCRAFLGRGLVGRYGMIVGIIMTSFLFGLIHVEPRQGTMAALMGLVLHYFYQTTRSLLIPMLLHFMNNSLSMVASNLQGGLEILDKAPETIPLAFYGGGFALLVAVMVTLYQTRVFLRPGPGPVLWEQPFPGVAYPPEGSGVEIVRPTLNSTSWIVLAMGLAIATVGFWVGFAEMGKG